MNIYTRMRLLHWLEPGEHINSQLIHKHHKMQHSFIDIYIGKRSSSSLNTKCLLQKTYSGIITLCPTQLTRFTWDYTEHPNVSRLPIPFIAQWFLFFSYQRCDLFFMTYDILLNILHQWYQEISLKSRSGSFSCQVTPMFQS